MRRRSEPHTFDQLLNAEKVLIEAALKNTGPSPRHTLLPMVALELVDAEAALAVAKRMAEQTGRTVTVRDADGKRLETFQGATKN